MTKRGNLAQFQLEKPQLLIQSPPVVVPCGMHVLSITQAQPSALQQHDVPCDTPS